VKHNCLFGRLYSALASLPLLCDRSSRPCYGSARFPSVCPSANLFRTGVEVKNLKSRMKIKIGVNGSQAMMLSFFKDQGHQL